MSVLYSKRNCDLRLEMIQKCFDKVLPDDIKRYLKTTMKEYQDHYNKGFVQRTSSPDQDFVFDGSNDPKYIYIMTDNYCRSSGDSFVYLCKKSPKVKVIGRSTLGVIDYSNISFCPVGPNVIMYPTSRMNWVDEGRGLDNIGVDVDHYIPFTPRHLEHDVDLEWIRKDYLKRKTETDYRKGL
jgi:C-terminal processing protease CtpA/Prc